MKELATLMHSLGSTEHPKLTCPECGGVLTATVTAYFTTTIDAEVGNDGSWARTRYSGKLVETKAEIAEQLRENYAGAEVDERDELHCSKCEWWTHPAELELALGRK